jgi:ABC-type transport system involved in Fe-S cluster assembly fused permease/ATPase subunit
MLCLLISNALHLLIPRQTGIIMDNLGDSSGSPWAAVLGFALLRLAASESGIELVRQWLWIPVKYYSQDALTRASFSHMMNLSADFHDSKSSSDMMMAIQAGHAVSNAIENVLLAAVPSLVDMCVAIVYLSITFGPYEGLITVATGTVYIMLATRLVAESKSASRKRVNAIYQEHHIRHAGLVGWQTVSTFNQIGFEDNRHANAVTNRWLKEQQYVMNWFVSIAFQTIVLTAGLMASAFLAVYRIRNEQATPGQFAMLLMYWAQLTSPLQFFAKLGKGMSDNFIDAERLLAIMKTKSTVQNKKNARPLKFASGEVVFEDVCFSYDKQKNILNGVSLQVPGGLTVAFVGATGAGKSTLLKLLTRFYDVTGGSIRIDGEDIRDVDLFR